MDDDSDGVADDAIITILYIHANLNFSSLTTFIRRKIER